jgi:hypothetical protein
VNITNAALPEDFFNEIGAFRALPWAPASVCCQIAQRALSPGDGNR